MYHCIVCMLTKTLHTYTYIYGRIHKNVYTHIVNYAYTSISRNDFCSSHFAMASYRWIVLAWSPRDGGWVRNFGYFKTEQDAWDCITQFLVLIQLHGDIEGFQVKRTIRF